MAVPFRRMRPGPVGARSTPQPSKKHALIGSDRKPSLVGKIIAGQIRNIFKDANSAAEKIPSKRFVKPLTVRRTALRKRK